MKVLRVFDFDGTLTHKDSLICFIRYAKGDIRFILIFLLYSIPIILMKLKLLPNWKVKESLFSFCFKGMDIDEFNRICTEFASDNKGLLRTQGIETIKGAQAAGEMLCVISASIVNWVKPFFKEIPINIIGTEIEVKDGKLTGKFLTKNCYGAEKVRRLSKEYGDLSDYKVIAYGDSNGDKELLSFATESHYKPFQ